MRAWRRSMNWWHIQGRFALHGKKGMSCRAGPGGQQRCGGNAAQAQPQGKVAAATAESDQLDRLLAKLRAP
ncbi:hypothetical protein CBM2585_B80220 [Cupriavidus taiwanensis]|nr:hypothetical protein CBM2585_B80220 [Cupriavidus taiwanensis]